MRRRIIRLSVLAGLCVLLVTLWLGWLRVSGNFHEVVAGELFRSRQPTQAQLEDWTQAHGLRSVVNLRGAAPGEAWYDAEVAAAARLGLRHVDLAWSASRQVDAAEAAQLLDILRDLPKPVLVHCKAGADRTGLASALYTREVAGWSEAEAGRQLSIRYGHFSVPVLSDAWPMDESWHALAPTLTPGGG